MTYITVNKDEKELLKKTLLDFVCRVTDCEGKRLPEEIAILPALIETLLNSGWSS